VIKTCYNNGQKERLCLIIDKCSIIAARGYRAMSECSKYQLLLQTDYVRLREKYYYLYIYSHNTILHCP
jgi:hypothetical protein